MDPKSEFSVLSRLRNSPAHWETQVQTRLFPSYSEQESTPRSSTFHSTRSGEMSLNCSCKNCFILKGLLKYSMNQTNQTAGKGESISIQGKFLQIETGKGLLSPHGEEGAKSGSSTTLVVFCKVLGRAIKRTVQLPSLHFYESSPHFLPLLLAKIILVKLNVSLKAISFDILVRNMGIFSMGAQQVLIFLANFCSAAERNLYLHFPIT